MKQQEVKELRNQRAIERNEHWQALTPQQQLDELDLRLGVNKGAKKQRAKIAKQLKKGN